MALRSTYETVKQAIQDVLAPELERIKGQLVALDAKVEANRSEIRSLEKRMEEGFLALRAEIGYTNKRIDEALDIRERLAALEAARPRP